MFTGLVESVGTIAARSVSGGAGKLVVKPGVKLDGLKKGDSIAVNGACLTLEKEDAAGKLVFHTLAETLKRSNLGSLKVGGKVNLERAMRLGDRIGGHLVSGHVDCVGKLLSLGKAGADVELSVATPEQLQPYLIEKGSVAIDGVSLTIASLSEGSFSVRLIPTTLEATALRFRKPGEALNLEGDLIGKYVLRQLRYAAPGKPGSAEEPKRGSHTLGMADLEKAGFN